MSSRSIKRDHYGYIFILPFFIVMLLFIIYPIIYSIFISFTQWDGSILAPKFIGFDNYQRLIKDPFFKKSIFNTVIIWVTNFIPQMIFGLGLAVILTDRKLKGKAFFRWAYFLPNLMSMASIATLVALLLDWQTGALNHLLLQLGIINEKIDWLQKIGPSRTAVSITLWWMWFGYSMIIFMAGIKAISEDLYEAGRVDGTNKWQAFLYITLPGLRRIITYNLVTSIIGGLTLYDIPALISNGTGAPKGSTLTMVMYVYNTAFSNYNFGYAATIGVGLFVLVLFFAMLAYYLMLSKEENT